MSEEEIAAVRAALESADPAEIRALAELMEQLADLVDAAAEGAHLAVLLAATETTKQ